MKDDGKWHWQDEDGKVVGPFDSEALRQLFSTGVVRDHTMVAKVGVGASVVVGNHSLHGADYCVSGTDVPAKYEFLMPVILRFLNAGYAIMQDSPSIK